MTALVLIGPPGAGKTTVGRELARLLGRGFVDTDDLVAQRAGASVGEIFVTHGEAAFRELERATVAEALARAEVEDMVLALGGGAPMDPETAAALEASGGVPDGPVVVFLDVSAPLAARRVGLGAARPLLAGSPRKVWRELMARRRPTYERLAHVEIEVDGLTPAAAAERIKRSVVAREE